MDRTMQKKGSKGCLPFYYFFPDSLCSPVSILHSYRINVLKNLTISKFKVWNVHPFSTFPFSK